MQRNLFIHPLQTNTERLRFSDYPYLRFQPA
jgi:hypothetical protein